MRGKTKVKLGYAYFAVAIIAVYYGIGFAGSGEISWDQFLTGTAVLAVMLGLVGLTVGGVYIALNLDEWKREN